MRTLSEVRNFTSQIFRLTPVIKLVWPEGFGKKHDVF